MKPPPRLIEILMRSNDPAADQVLAAGLPFVDSALQLLMIDKMVARAKEDRLEPLLQVFDRLSLEGQTRVVAANSHLFSVLRVGVRAPLIQTRLNSFDIIRRSRNPRLAYLAASGLRDGSHHVRAEAAQALRDLAEIHCANHAETTAALRDACDGAHDLGMPIAQTLRLLGEERQQLIAALRESLAHFESHHRPEVLEAAMYLAEELEDSLFQIDSLKRGKFTETMMQIYSHSPSVRLAPFTYIGLKYSELRRRIVSVLARLTNPDFFCEFIRNHWLAKDPEVRRNLSTVRSLVWLSDGFEAAFNLPPHIAVVAPSWLLALGVPSNEKVRLLMNFLMIDNPDANVAAVWALTRIATPSANLALQGAQDHEDERVRSIASHEVRHRARLDEGQTRPARRDRPEEWGELLDKSGLNEEFDDFWVHSDRLPAELAGRAGPHAMKFIPNFLTQMQVKLMAAHPVDRMRALKLLSELNLVDRFSKEAFALANDSVAEIRAAAMRALAVLADPTSKRIVERALSDASPLVQAAAIEAIDRLSLPKRVELFMPKTNSDDAEVRAAAILALLKLQVPKAAVALVEMLKDGRSTHRCHALWIIERLRLTTLAPKVAELAESEGDSKMARIAQQVLRRLERHQKAPGVSSRQPEIARAS